MRRGHAPRLRRPALDLRNRRSATAV